MKDSRHGHLHGLGSQEKGVGELCYRDLSEQKPGTGLEFPSHVLVYVTKGHVHCMHRLIP